MAQGRVQTQELRSDIQLRPAPIQSDTFAAPAAPVRNDNMLRLADALGSFSNSIGNLIPTLAASQKENAKKAEEAQLARFQQRIGGMTLAEVNKEIQEGRMEKADSPWRQAAQSTIYGAKFAQALGAETDEALKTEFDWTNGDPEKFLAERFQKAMEARGETDPNFIGSAARAWDSYKSQVFSQKEQYRINKSNEDASNASVTFIHDQVNQMITEGASPEDIGKRVHSFKSDLGKKGALGLNYEDIDAQIVNEAARQASTNPKAAIALLTTPNGDLPALASNPKYLDRASQIMAEASKVRGRQLETETLARLDSENVQRIVKGAGFDDVQDFVYTSVDGTEKTVTKKEQEDNARRIYFQEEAARQKANGETGGMDTTVRQFRELRRSNLEHPVITSKLTGLASNGAPDLLSNPEAKARQVEKMELYKTLKSENKNSIFSVVKDGQDRDYAEAYYAAQRYLGMSQDEALTFAYKSANLDTDAKARVARERDRVDSAVSQLDTTSWLGSDVANNSMVRDKISDLAVRYVASGAPVDKAIQAAGKAFAESTLTYNGVVIDVGNARSRAAMPDNWKGSVDAQVDNFMTLATKKGYDRGDVTIMQMGDDGRFFIADKDTLRPLTDDKGSQYLFTLSDLRDWDIKTQKQTEKYDLRQHTFEANVKAKGYVHAVDADGSEVWVNPKTREIMDMKYGDDDATPKWTNTGSKYKRGVIVNTDGGFVLKRPKMNIPLNFKLFGGIAQGIVDVNKQALANGPKTYGEAVERLTPSVPNIDTGFIKVGKPAEEANRDLNGR